MCFIFNDFLHVVFYLSALFTDEWLAYHAVDCHGNKKICSMGEKIWWFREHYGSHEEGEWPPRQFCRAKEFDPVMTSLQKIQETIGEHAKKTSQGMKLMENKMDQLKKKIDKLESYLLELNSHVCGEQTRPTHKPVDAKEVNAHDKKSINSSSSSLEDSFKLKQKLVAAFNESMVNPKPFSTVLKDELDRRQRPKTLTCL